ncbi:MAG: hypothetical protein ACREUA_05770 [Burkholderiales bacterium]
MIDYGEMIFIGVSGDKYRFLAYPLDAVFAKVGAAFMVMNRKLSREYHPNYTRVFVGQTGDLSAGFGTHPRSDCFARYAANCVCIYLEEQESSRLTIARDLVENYHPPCNE